MELTSSIAAQNYANARSAAAPKPSTGQEANPFEKVAADFATTLQQGETQALSAMGGTADAHSLVAALAQTELAVQTAVTVRDKVVEAYQEILRMPV